MHSCLRGTRPPISTSLPILATVCVSLTVDILVDLSRGLGSRELGSHYLARCISKNFLWATPS